MKPNKSILLLGLAAASDVFYLAAFTLASEVPMLSYVALFGLALGILNVSELVRSPAGGASVVAYPFSLFAPALATLWRRSRTRARNELRNRSVYLSGGSPQWRRQKVGFASVLVVFLVMAVTGALDRQVINPAFAPVDTAAKNYLNDSLVQSLGAYAAARAIDRSISVLSESSVSAGVGASLSTRPGMVAKPLQDFLERFSDTMLWIMGSIGIQLAVIDVGTSIAVPIFLSVFLSLLLASLFIDRPEIRRRLDGLAKVFVMSAIALRVLVPVVALLVVTVTSTVLDERREQALSTVSEEQELTDAPLSQPDDEGVIGRAMSFAGEIGSIVADVPERADRLIDGFLTLLIVFLIETIVAPLAVLFLLWRVWRTIASSPHVRHTAEQFNAGRTMVESRTRGLSRDSDGSQPEIS